MAINQTATVTLDINNANATQRLNELQKQANNLSDAIKKAYEAGDKSTAKQLTVELKKTSKEIQNIQKSADTLNMAMSNISTAKPKELRKMLAAINKEMESPAVARGSKEWENYNQQLIRVKNELAKINEEQKAALPLYDRLSAGVSRFKGAIVGIGASITGIVAATASMRDYANRKDTAKAGLQALTGLDDESVNWLQTQAEQMSQVMDETGLRVTQSTDEILEAYKLVGSAKPELLAVKEDLNKVTVETIRLAQAAGIDLNAAVTATTISMNQFGASADEAERYVNVLAAGSKTGAVAVENINEAVVKSGVAASQAGLSIEELVGSIETIGERGLQGAKAGTGLKSFFLTLMTGADDTNPKVVGLQKAMENLAAKNLSEAEMMKMFGKEAYNVAAIMTQSTDALSKYTAGVTGTNTAVEQAARMGDTAAAKAAQLKNQIAEIGQEIYKDIQPVIDMFLTKSVSIMKVLQTLIGVLKNYGGAIAALIAPIVAYNTVMAIQNALHSKAVTAIAAYIKQLFSMQTIEKAVTAGKYLLASATLLLSGNVEKATVAFKAFSRALSLSPIGLIAAAITAVVAGMTLWIRRSRELIQEQKNQKAIADMNLEIEKKVNDQTATEVSRIERLRAAIHDKNLSEKTRTAAIKELQKILPAYNAELSKEGEVISENTKAINDYIDALKKKARAVVVEEKLTDISRQKLDIESELEANELIVESYKESLEEIQTAQQQFFAEGHNLGDWAGEIFGKGSIYESLSAEAQILATQQLEWDGSAKKMQKSAMAAQKRVEELREQLSPLLAQEQNLTNWINSHAEETGALPGTTSTTTEEPKKLDASDIERQAEQMRLAADKMFVDNLSTYAEYQRKLLDIEKWAIEQKMSLTDAESKEYFTLAREKLALQKKYTDLSAKLIDQDAAEQKAKLTVQYRNGLMTTTDYQNKTLEIELKALQDKQSLYRENQTEYADIQKQIDEKLQQQNSQRVAVLRSQLEAENKELERLLAMRLAQGLMTEEQYNEAIYMNELEYLKKLRDSYSVYADEYVEITARIKDAELKHQTEAAKRYAENLKNFNAQYTDKIAVQEYQQGAASIDEMQKRGDISAADADRAKTDLGGKLLDAQVKLIQSQNSGIIDTYKARYEAIQNLEQQGIISHEQAEQQKLAATTDMLGQMTQIYEGAWSSIDSILGASSQLIQANADLETAKIESEYDKRIEAAGRNRRKVEKLEKERDEKIRAMKTKANEKAMKIELAGAIAQTAVAAINAYSSAAAIPVAGWVLGPIAAAAALAAGAIQIAAIKKQQQAEAAGYAAGGFTPRGKWDEPQGVVHSNEFVANRYAVGNPAIRPALNLIDRAQRNNTVGSLTAEDVSASLYSRTSPDVVKAVNAQQAAVASAAAEPANTEALEATANAVAQNSDVLRRLSDRLDEGITAIASIDGRNGINHQQEKYNQLINNAR